MGGSIAHRGPDSEGYWMDAGAGIGFAHRRLAIVDLSAAGHQPMASPSGRYVIAFNGEIYNHGDLRAELNGAATRPVSWRGHSDTETLLAGFDAWGVETTVRKTIGMFAFVLWDRKSRVLTLVRDRLGEKPLYYGWQGNGSGAVFLFGSELGALRAHPAFEGKISREGLGLLLQYNYIGGHNSIYSGIRKLEPGTILELKADSTEPVIKQYWSLWEAVESGREHSFSGSPAEAVDALDILLRDAVGRQMMADVPLGAFLSGGIDSSAVVALMQAQSERPIKTFSIGFHEQGFNEAEHAKAVAAHLGTEHTEHYVTGEQALAVVPKLPTLYSEPFADSSQIPTFLVSEMARAQVTVALSGDGGDEVFCGYNRYQMTDRLWGRLRRIPRPLRRAGAGLIRSLPPAAWDRLGRLAGYGGAGDKLYKGAGVLARHSVKDLYHGLTTFWSERASVVVGHSEISSLGYEDHWQDSRAVESMMATDMVTYLPHDILAKVDRAAMGVSLETRVPYLDHRVVEFAWTLPLDIKLRGGTTKWPLREVLYRYVPRSLIERPKMGFGVPIGEWLRGALRPWAEALLSEERLRAEGYLNPAPIRQAWAEHQSGRRNWQYQLWGVLMFQAWLETQRRG